MTPLLLFRQLLQEIDTQQRIRRIGRLASILTRFGVVRLDQVDQRLSWSNQLNLRKKLHPLGLLLGGDELVVKEAELINVLQLNLKNSTGALVQQ